MQGLKVFQIENGLCADLTHTMYPTRVWGHVRGQTSYAEPGSCYYCFVPEGKLVAARKSGPGRWDLTEGMYLSSSDPFVLEGYGRALVIERLGFRGLFSVGGPVERSGRLTYIDSCTSTVLVSPPRQGDPCLNLLHFPAHTRQTNHIHPTIRVGCVVSGTGSAVELGQPETPLRHGQAFFIDQNVPHFFATEQDPLSVIAFHPDSDWGPTDQAHPMLNRTYLR